MRAKPSAPKLPDPSPGLRAPSWWLMLLEGRAPWEYAALLAATPWLRAAPAGDGHPVLVFPGLGAPDVTTWPLRSYLRERGYAAYPWEQGFNFGPRRGVLEACQARVKELSRQHGGARVSLIGWSLGGLYAREIAKELPSQTRCVITLGSPFTGHPRATNAWRLFDFVSGHTSDDAALLEQLRQPPPVPTTSIYSRSDGVVAWQCSLNPATPLTENIEVHSSHIGMGLNPLALYAVADRLAQDPSQWRRFDASGVRRWLYKVERDAASGQ